MKKHISKIISLFIIVWMLAYTPGSLFAADNVAQSKAQDKKNGIATVKVGYLENILFEKLSGKDRINLVVSQQPFTAPVVTQKDNSLLIKLENMFVPENLRHSLGDGQLININDLSAQQEVADGKQWIYLTINLKENVPCVVRQEGFNIFIDFNISSIEEKNKIAAAKNKKITTGGKKTAEKVVADNAKNTAAEQAEAAPVKRQVAKRYTDRMISLDFQEADIKSVLRLMAEYGNISIVSGDDVKGNVTLTMKNVPWEQALESILDVHGLAKKQMGDVISIMTLERKKKDENDKKEAEKDQILAEETRKARETKVLAEKGKLRQILIEAKIVEASDEFVRNLGVQWGFGGNQSIGSYGSGISGGTNALQTRSWARQYPPEIDYNTPLVPLYMAAVNMPAALTASTLGVVFGKGASFLEAQLAALETNTTGKVISAPKVVTMDDIKAIIKQGDEIPYITRTVNEQTGSVTTSITFKEAVLKLEVKPKITDEGRISMEIKAGNDVADYALAEKLFGNPPIHKNYVDSTVVIQDGDTVVIGGVTRDQNQTIVTGVPWLQKVPVLGWLFKAETITRQKKQLLIFITPKILKGNSFNESSEKAIN